MQGDDAFDPTVEHEAIRKRRGLWAQRAPGVAALPAQHPSGVAFSGGGIRSATFSLGLAQALAQKKLFPQVDYLSTVSGGGYTGSFLGSLFLPRKANLTVRDPLEQAPAPLPDNMPVFDPPAPAAETIEPDAGAASTAADLFGDDKQPASPDPAPVVEPRPPAPVEEPDESALDAAERAERVLTDDPHVATLDLKIGSKTDTMAVFHPILWLRENGRYLTPSGATDLLYMAAFYLRALIGVFYVLGLLMLGGVLAIYLVRMGLHLVGQQVIGGSVAPYLDGLGWDLAVAKDNLLWWSPILWIGPVVGFVAGGPFILAYWLVFRQEKKGTLTTEEWAIKLGPWWLLFVAAVAIALVARFDSASNPLLVVLGYGVYLSIAVLLLQRFVLPGWLLATEDWTQTAPVARVRLKLTQGLTTVLKIVLLGFAAGLVDTIGQNVFVALVRGRAIDFAALGASGGAIGVLVVLARKFGSLAVTQAARWRKVVVRMQTTIALVAALLALLAIASLLVVLVQWVVWSPLIGSWHGKAEAVLRASHWALFAGLVIAWLLLAGLVRESLGFLNNSTFHRFYGARLVRTFLGAANFKRLRAFQEAISETLREQSARTLFVSESHPDDDVALRSYYAGASAGPLHLICTTLNESLSETSNLVREDRKGVTLAVGPLGLNVDERFFRWNDAPGDIGSRLDASRLPAPPPTASAAERQAYDQQRSCERLPVGSWVAISGAAVSTGLGHMSSLGFSILAWLVNARLGYWWIAAPMMSTERRESAWKTFDLVQQELTGGFYGQRGKRWSLSDGGHFENTAVYELLRRRAALIVCSDNGADGQYRFNDIQNLVRRARIDFGAEIDFMDRTELDTFIKDLAADGHDVARYFGTMEEFALARKCVDDADLATASSVAPDDRCALAARVRYAPDPARPDLAHEALLVVVKPAVTQFAPLDVKLYARAKPQFPQQTTGDQFFDEAQWESYRKLGLEIGLRVFGAWDGYVKVARRLATGPSTRAAAL